MTFVATCLVLCLASCANDTGELAPVVNGWAVNNTHDVYRVASGDTLYSIAWRYGLDYRTLANINHINAPYEIAKGELIQLSAKHKKPLSKQNIIKNTARKTVQKLSKPHVNSLKVVKKQPLPNKPRYNAKYSHVSQWNWPVRNGKIIKTYSKANKGLDIGGKLGQSVMTTAPGVVVYAGSGIRGYGKLLIVKHNADYLSAYAHNRKLLVREGQTVRKGQVIALMGKTGSNEVMLHFEIRHNGKPVNPLSLLGRRK